MDKTISTEAGDEAGEKTVLKNCEESCETSNKKANGASAEAFVDASSCSSLSQESSLVENGACNNSSCDQTESAVIASVEKFVTKENDGEQSTTNGDEIAADDQSVKHENGDTLAECGNSSDRTSPSRVQESDDKRSEDLLEDEKQIQSSSPLNLSARPSGDEDESETSPCVVSSGSDVKSEVIDNSDDDEPQVLDLSKHDKPHAEEESLLQRTSADAWEQKAFNHGGRRTTVLEKHWQAASSSPGRQCVESGDSRASSPSVERRQQKMRPKPPVDNVRPTARLLYDLGLDLVRQEVYKDLIDIQEAKDREQKLDEKEKNQLIKLTEAHTRLKVKNSAYALQRLRCKRCKFSCSAATVERLHQEHGHFSQNMVHVCCICDTFHTRYPSQFIIHMESVHKINARLTRKLLPAVCAYCSYEHKNSLRVELHAAKCCKKFQLSCNLQPMPPDCDIPIRQRIIPWGGRVAAGSQYGQGAGGQNYNSTQSGPRFSQPAASSVQSNVMEIGGQLYSWSSYRGKPLLTSLRSQIGNNFVTTSSNGIPVAVTGSSRSSSASSAMSARALAQLASSLKQEMCEICGVTVATRQALWNHLQSAHKFESDRVTNEPSIFCDICNATFWTYQGLARHSLLQHKKSIAPNASQQPPQRPGQSSQPMQRPGHSTQPPQRSGQTSQSPQRNIFKCHYCGVVQSVNPLNHLSTNHNITLLDMYHSRQCCMCNRKLRNEQAFEQHMVLEHRDIFANQDVLKTVLQALSTALHLKSDGAQHKPSSAGQHSQAKQNFNSQPRTGPSYRMGTPAAKPSASNVYSGSSSWPRHKSPMPQNFNSRPGPPHAGSRPLLAHANSRPGSFNANIRPLTANSRSAHSNPSTPMMSRGPSSNSSQANNSAGGFASHPQTAVKKTRVKPSAAEQLTPIKPPVDRKVAEEEVKKLDKLYKDYADLGRPISRSMKQRLLSSSGNKSTVEGNGGGGVAADEDSGGSGRENEKNKICSTDSNAHDEVDEPSSKKPRLESTEQQSKTESVTS